MCAEEKLEKKMLSLPIIVKIIDKAVRCRNNFVVRFAGLAKTYGLTYKIYPMIYIYNIYILYYIYMYA